LGPFQDGVYFVVQRIGSENKLPFFGKFFPPGT
jgi:hypothetical protein